MQKQKREFYRRGLPHFQQPGQAYFVAWNLKYTLNNPVAAGYVSDWNDWPGCWKSPEYIGL